MSVEIIEIIKNGSEVIEVIERGPQGPQGVQGPSAVTSVAVSGSDGIEVDSGSPITSEGTIALGINATALRNHINVADGAEVNVQANWTEVDSGSDAFILNKPSTFPPSAHTHEISEITNLQNSLDSKLDAEETTETFIFENGLTQAEVFPARRNTFWNVSFIISGNTRRLVLPSLLTKNGDRIRFSLTAPSNTTILIQKPSAGAAVTFATIIAGQSYYYSGRITRFIGGIPIWTEESSIVGLASSIRDGVMSSEDKIKLDGIASNANNYTHPNHTGEVTSSGDGATTIANDVVTNAKLANVATATLKGRATEGTGDPEDLTATQVRTILNVADGAEVNVNADWNAATGDAAILNKPSTFPPSSHTHQAADLFGVLKLATDSYIVAEAGDNLATKYAAAKALTPNGNPLSATNRAALVIMPATYSLAADLTVDAEFVDVIGLGAQKLHRGSIPAVVFANNRIIVSANNVRVQGISVGTQNFIIQSNLPLQRIEDCTGGNESFGGFGTASGTFINCVGGVFAFGGEGSAVGTFANCVGGANSFGYIADASGSFINCVSGGSGFGSTATASGLFIDCDGPFGDFGTGGTASGTFINCTSGDLSFGSDTGSATGTFVNCTGGEYSFGGGGGGGISGNATGKFYNCRLTAGTFWPVTSGGLMRNCIDGNNNLVDQ